MSHISLVDRRHPEPMEHTIETLVQLLSIPKATFVNPLKSRTILTGLELWKPGIDFIKTGELMVVTSLALDEAAEIVTIIASKLAFSSNRPLYFASVLEDGEHPLKVILANKSHVSLDRIDSLHPDDYTDLIRLKDASHELFDKGSIKIAGYLDPSLKTILRDASNHLESGSILVISPLSLVDVDDKPFASWSEAINCAAKRIKQFALDNDILVLCALPINTSAAHPTTRPSACDFSELAVLCAASDMILSVGPFETEDVSYLPDQPYLGNIIMEVLKGRSKGTIAHLVYHRGNCSLTKITDADL